MGEDRWNVTSGHVDKWHRNHAGRQPAGTSRCKRAGEPQDQGRPAQSCQFRGYVQAELIVQAGYFENRQDACATFCCKNTSIGRPARLRKKTGKMPTVVWLYKREMRLRNVPTG